MVYLMLIRRIFAFYRLTAALAAGLFGVTRADLEEQVRPQIVWWVRTGYFNQEDYPFTQLCQDFSPVNSSTPANQQMALQAAQAGVVLLKALKYIDFCLVPQFLFPAFVMVMACLAGCSSEPPHQVKLNSCSRRVRCSAQWIMGEVPAGKTKSGGRRGRHK